jgi:hypothetical protein
MNTDDIHLEIWHYKQRDAAPWGEEAGREGRREVPVDRSQE